MCSQQAPEVESRPLRLRVFLSSPGDVTDERSLASTLLKDELPYRTFLRDQVTFDVVSWDDPAARVPMLANLTPQESVNRSMPKPSACHIVVVILWSRMGTELPATIQRVVPVPSLAGTVWEDRYLSGTEWEFEDAVHAGPVPKTGRVPEVLVYRRSLQLPEILAFHGVSRPKDQRLSEVLDQLDRVETFFARFKDPSGGLAGGVTPYDTPSAFRDLLAADIERLIKQRLDALPPTPAPCPQPGSTLEPLWHGSPYPGLRPFTFEEAAVFFGRGRETDALVARLQNPAQRFLAVVGASGTGKSSLVRAGLLPRLAEGAIEGSQHWRALTFTPAEISDNPFQALATKLSEMLPPGDREPAREITTALTTAPQRITDYAAMILAGRPAGAVLVLVIDQFEEMFTHVTAVHQASFIDLLTHATGDPRLRVLATVRADFLPRCMAEPKLAALLQGAAGTFPLGPPGPVALADMVRKPAERAGLDVKEDLVEEILKDAGADPGVLPLVAFCLEALYRRTAPEYHLTVVAYEALGRLRGAIRQQADALRADLQKTEGMALETALPQLFRALVHVDAAGTATRRRAFREELSTELSMPRLAEALVQGRLLVAEEISGRATITLGHEVLLATWPDLCEWLDRNRAQMQRLQRWLQRLQRWLLNLEAPDTSDRRRATEVLGEMGPMAPEVVPALIAALGDADEGVRSRATAALGQMGFCVPVLQSHTGDAL